MSFVAGETVGAYRITEQLGSGGMATVFKAYHAALDRYVAIKVLHPAFKEDPSFLARFQREARVVARLEHPNIVPVYDFSDHDGQPYLVMRYIEGETLKARLARGPLSMGQALSTIHAVGVALIYAHSQDVLHRDIKPSNVILTPKGEVFLTDFGLARIAQAGESTLSQDSILGTPQYISPEQAKGDRDLDARTDIYSLGVVIYELLVGRVPYQADTPFAVVHDHIFTPLPLPRSINPHLPEPLERFLLKVLSKNRDDRFASIQDMLAGLNRAVDESGTGFWQDSGLEPHLPPQRSGAGLGGHIWRSEPAKASIPTQAPTVISAQPAASAVPKTAETPAVPVRRPVSPLVWVGLGAVIVIALVAIVLVSRPNPVTTPDVAGQPTPALDQLSEPKPAVGDLLQTANRLFRDGNDQAQQGRLDAARATFERAAATAEEGLRLVGTPDLPVAVELHVLAAESWLAAGDPKSADAHLKPLQDMDPANLKASTGIALSLLMQNRPDESVKVLDQVLRRQPDAATAHALKGCALLKRGDRLAAAREFRQAAGGATGPAVVMPWMRMALSQLDCQLER